MDAGEGSVVEWAVAGLALGGHGEHRESGDLHVIVRHPDGALVAVIDGLGHGAEAALAARTAALLLDAHRDEPVLALVQRCHDGLRQTRGVAMSLASFDTRSGSMTWVGIGDVEGVLLRALPVAGRSREALIPRSGIVGYVLPPLRSAQLPVSPGDTLIMATDGVRSGFADGVDGTRPPQETADAILARYGKGTDDALVAVARYVGSTR